MKLWLFSLLAILLTGCQKEGTKTITENAKNNTSKEILDKREEFHLNTNNVEKVKSNFPDGVSTDMYQVEEVLLKSSHKNGATFEKAKDPFAGLPFNSGTVVAADYAENRDAIDLWKYISNSLLAGKWNSCYVSWYDTQIVWYDSEGDPLPALDGQVHPGHRLLQTHGSQSKWDFEFQKNHTRSQLGGWTDDETIHVSREGQREFIVFSLKLEDVNPENQIRGTVRAPYPKTGLDWLSMVSQFKSYGAGNGVGSPNISIYEGNDGLQFAVQEYENDAAKYYVNVPDVPRGVWLRIGLDVMWSSGVEGAYRWWGDLDGDSSRNFVPLSEKRSAQTLRPGYSKAAMNIGPYHIIKDGEDTGVVRNGRRYSNIEFLKHDINDRWD